MTKALIADDHPIVRQGLKQILYEESDMETVGEAADSNEVLELAGQQDWDIVILDITMPGRGGLDVLKELRQNYPGLPVLILSIHPEDQYAVRALKAGAAGYLTKESAPEELIRAMRTVLKGKKYISSSLAEKLADYLEREDQKNIHEILSDREYQVMVMITSGKSIKEIAEDLSLSIKTISTYRARIFEKMKLKSNAELIRYAINKNLV
jgi:two-component system, NarL family, invasion response regulator UvrY